MLSVDLVLEYVWLSVLFYRCKMNLHLSLQDSQAMPEVSEDVSDRSTTLDLKATVILQGPLSMLGHLPGMFLLL